MDPMQNDEIEPIKPFGDVECTAMGKTKAASSENPNEQFIIFTGGIPEELDGRNTISIFCSNRSLILDFDSTILDFHIYQENEIALALFVLCEEELVAIDLQDTLWRMFPLPYLYPIHSSPITCITAASGLTAKAGILFSQIAHTQRKASKIYTKSGWPLERDVRPPVQIKEMQLIITGHENGIVNIWLTNDLEFRLLLSCNTAREFEGYHDGNEEVEAEQNNCTLEEGTTNNNNCALPPIRKAGVFDPFSDDQRLCIQRIHFDPASGELAVGGQAGQILVFEGLLETKTVQANELLLLDMTASTAGEHALEDAMSNRMESAIQARTRPISSGPGFSLINGTIAQFKPPVPISAICWDSASGILAAGNEFGYAICSLARREVLLVNTLISSQDVIQIANKDSAISRFKSVKKSIRQSFRRKKKSNPTDFLRSEETITEDGPKFRRNEREIFQRNGNPNALGGETPNSLVKVLKLLKCNISPTSSTAETHLFVGTHGGSVLIHALRIGEGEIGSSEQQCPLIKEIRLQHQAPIMAIECLQNYTHTMSTRLLVFSEEQIRSFVLPSLKSSSFKYRLTATEGSRIRKAAIVQLMSSRARRMRNTEKFTAITTNRGEIYLISPSYPKKFYKIDFTQPSDSAGIFSSVITADGQLFFLRPGGSELERCSLNGSNQPNMPK